MNELYGWLRVAQYAGNPIPLRGSARIGGSSLEDLRESAAGALRESADIRGS